MFSRIVRRIRSESTRLRDVIAAAAKVRTNPRAWPCRAPMTMVVGCESSGTTPISHLLLAHTPGRFLYEEENRWVWTMYQSVYNKQSRVRDYPRLQLFAKLKVPGFAAILRELTQEFPNAKCVYIVRDPRDVIASAFRTWRARSRDELQSIPWVSETWLNIEEIDPIVRLARRWSIYVERSGEASGVHYVRYEDFCADKVAFIRNLAETLDIPWNAAAVASHCDEQASTPFLRNYQPRGAGSWKTDGQLSATDVSLIEDICGEQMSRWHYT